MLLTLHRIIRAIVLAFSVTTINPTQETQEVYSETIALIIKVEDFSEIQAILEAVVSLARITTVMPITVAVFLAIQTLTTTIQADFLEITPITVEVDCLETIKAIIIVVEAYFVI
jgi:Zn finger protein HypA/HybF involved in hydrogenase expression